MSNMLAHLAEVSIRSLLVAFPAAIVLWVLRRRRTAALQHAVWTAVVCGMLGLFALGQALPRLPLRILDGPDTLTQTAPLGAAVDRLLLDDASSAGTLQSRGPVTATARRSIDWSGMVMYGYGAIVFAFLAQFTTGLFLVRKLLASAHPISIAGESAVYESERISVGCPGPSVSYSWTVT